VKNTFLHGDLEEELFMELPLGPQFSLVRGKVCKVKVLYGLKQSPRAWFDRFFRAMQRFDYKQSQAIHTLFIKHSSQRKVTALIVGQKFLTNRFVGNFIQPTYKNDCVL
jgi:hypothetical protein